MDKIIKKNGYVYLVKNWDRKGFETLYNMGKDPDDPMWQEEDKPKKKRKRATK